MRKIINQLKKQILTVDALTFNSKVKVTLSNLSPIVGEYVFYDGKICLLFKNGIKYKYILRRDKAKEVFYILPKDTSKVKLILLPKEKFEI